MFTEILNIVDLLGQPTVVIVTVGPAYCCYCYEPTDCWLVFPFGGRATRASYRAHPTSTAVALQVGNFVKAMLASVDALELLRLSEKAMPNSCAHRPAGTPETCTTSHSFSNVSPWALLLAYCC